MTNRPSAAEPLVLVVDESTADLTTDDRVLAEAIDRMGGNVRTVIWGDPVSSVEGRLLLRSTWDYVDRPIEFAAWLDQLDAAGVEVHNPTSMLRWNMHKRYLRDLADAGVPTVPTVLLPSGVSVDLERLRRDLGQQRLVVKPAIGASARLTIDSERAGEAAMLRHLTDLLRVEDAIVQPYLDSIADDGEVSVIAIGGQLTHAVVKRPAAGDWRVQSNFGGSADLIELTASMHEIADLALSVLDVVPTYARIDVVRIDGGWSVLEFELIEPELFFGRAPHAAESLATLMMSSNERSAQFFRARRVWKKTT